MVWLEQPWQNSLPHHRQWCLRRHSVKVWPQPVQLLHVASGTQYCVGFCIKTSCTLEVGNSVCFVLFFFFFFFFF